MKVHDAGFRFWRLFVGLLLVVMLVGAASSGIAATSGTVKAKVQYRDAAGVLHPLPGVEVFVGGAGVACTNDKGIAIFPNTPTGDHIAATGPSLSSPACPNYEFLAPGTGLKLYAVWYNQHVGVRQWDVFEVVAGQTTTIVFRTKAPKQQIKVCGGRIATIKGTAGDDTLVGTPGEDVISGGLGNDTIEGLGTDAAFAYDWLCGGPGNDVILGGDGDDVMFGGVGSDDLAGDAGNDTAFGGPGKDTCDAETELDCEK